MKGGLTRGVAVKGGGASIILATALGRSGRSESRPDSCVAVSAPKILAGLPEDLATNRYLHRLPNWPGPGLHSTVAPGHRRRLPERASGGSALNY